jgi:hypothetical protein
MQHDAAREEDDMLNWEVIVRTGDIDGGGTDANVSISLIGTDARTHEFNLDNLHRNDFEQGGMDHFLLPDVGHIGDLRAIAIRQDMQSMYAAWFLEDVFVRRLPDGPRHRFHAHRWLEGGTGDKCVGLILTEHYGWRCFTRSNKSSESLGGDVASWIQGNFKEIGEAALAEVV